MSFNYQKISQTDWYQQGGAFANFFILNAYRSGQQFAPLFVHNKGALNTGYFDKAKEGRLARKYLIQQKKNPCFLRDWIGRWRQRAKKQSNFLKVVDTKKFLNFSGKQVSRYFEELAQIVLNFWLKAVFIEFYDPWGEVLLQEELNNFPKIKLKADEITTLTAPFKLSFVHKEILSRYQLVLQAKKNPTLAKVIRQIPSRRDLKKLEKFPKFYQALKAHTKNFFWLKNTWGEAFVLDEWNFLKEIKKDLDRLKKAQAEVKKLLNYEKGICQAKRKIIQRHRLPKDLLTVFDFFATLADWRDERKKHVLLYVHYLNEIAKELAKRNKINPELVKVALPQEFKGWTIPDSLVKTLKDRAKECLILVDKKGRITWIGTPQRRKILQAIADFYKRRYKEITGVSASPGQARGRVKIIETIPEFKKMKKGDVLVAKMTRPEFLPIMKLASAILTDEGGLTCHAAIVSRELGIPCLVGTQVATRNLRDGQMVEVDANKGIVRILK